MIHRKPGPLALLIALVVASLVATACGSDSAGLTQEEVREIARSEVAASAPAQVQPGLSRTEVEEAIQTAIANLPEAQPGLSRAEVEEALQSALSNVPDAAGALTTEEVRTISAQVVAAIPLRSDPARYTQFVVDSAIARYEAQGLSSTVSHYSNPSSVDGQWYVFVLDQNGKLISHFNPDILGENLKGPLGTDANGYNFGPEMLSATREGKWVSYVYNNPATRDTSSNHLGEVELKHAWVVRHDDLLFGSGWYVNADEFTMQLVAEAVDDYHSLGLEGTVAQFAGSNSATAGLSDTIAFYNSAEDITGDWFAMIVDRGGTIVAHYDPTLIGSSAAETYGAEILEASDVGNWVTSESLGSFEDGETLRAWVVGHDGMIFAAGWYHEEQGN